MAKYRIEITVTRIMDLTPEDNETEEEMIEREEQSLGDNSIDEFADSDAIVDVTITKVPK